MSDQKEFQLVKFTNRPTGEIVRDVLALHRMWKSGALGGEHMPEDVHPDLPADSPLLLHYLTLGMCLNYQRNSYKLWEACTSAYDTEADRWVFDPMVVCSSGEDQLREVLVRHRIALQPNKHVGNWYRLCGGIVQFGDGDVRNILKQNSYDIDLVRSFIQENRKFFPYLAGNKICNYWLYVLWQYTSLPISNKEALTVAPDTHVINASVRLGLLSIDDAAASNAQERCVLAWDDILKNTSFAPIDIHTPLWLWSRLKFPSIDVSLTKDR
ncbi:hypothetical protein ACK8OR_13235 [Jannaschia sp. KMU-145]|uniref:hypothetical protein n=1 Tax=Jannaschia halovivens TaxID=3388667 RepID=UPI00396B1A7C